MIKPLYIFSGFLDSGKTTEIKRALLDPRFTQDEKTLIICFEQGDVEYEQAFLKKTNSVVEYLDSISDLTIDKQKELDRKHKADRTFIELNGMEDDGILFNEIGIINNWEIAQVLTTVDASNFNLYITNMRQFMYNHVFYADLAILNRCDNVDKKYLRNNLKSINMRLQLIYENADGSDAGSIEDELFDTSKDLVIEDMDYGLWFMDCNDNPEKYDGKIISLKVKYIENIKEANNALIMGRKAMVCCNNDITPIAMAYVGLDKKKIDKDKYYLIKGKIHLMENKNTGDRACMMEVMDYNEAIAPENELVTFG